MNNNNITYIKAKTNLYNGGLCFTKGNIYEVKKNIQTVSSLMDISVINDLGEKHNIGSWWREFEIVKDTED